MKVRWIILALGAIGAIVVGLSWLFSPREPVYQGRPLSYWFDQLTEPYSEPARGAIRGIGPAVVPFLLRKVRDDQGAFRQFYRDAWPRFPSVLQHLVPKPRPRDGSLLMRMKWAVRSLGPAAVPQLSTALHNKSVPIRCAAVEILGSMRSYPDAVIPALGQALQDPNPEVRLKVVAALTDLGPKQTNVISALTQVLRDTDRGSDGSIVYVREQAARALGRIGPEAQRAVPELTALLSQTNSYTRQQAVIALWRITHDTNLVSNAVRELENAPDAVTYRTFLEVLGLMGTAAKSAVPDIRRTSTNQTRLQNLPAGDMARSISEALSSIDPPAAKDASVQMP